jgi:hypothetical protein
MAKKMDNRKGLTSVAATRIPATTIINEAVAIRMTERLETFTSICRGLLLVLPDMSEYLLTRGGRRG